MTTSDEDYLSQPVKQFLHHDFITLKECLTCKEALEQVRVLKDDQKVFYFYTVDENNKLTGVVPVRRFLMSDPQRLLADMAQKNLITIQDNVTLKEAAEAFSHHKYLSLPVLDSAGRVSGVVDLKALTGRDIDVSDRKRLEEVFQTIGVRLDNLGKAGFLGVFTNRFPWLLASVASGFTCAWLSSRYEATLEKNIILSFFIALVLALGESVSIQSMSLGFQESQKKRRQRKSYWHLLLKELLTGLALGIPLGAIVGLLSWFLHPQGIASVLIGFSISISVINACLIGLTLPFVLTIIKGKGPSRVAAGPLVLAITDISTLIVYLTSAFLFL